MPLFIPRPSTDRQQGKHHRKRTTVFTVYLFLMAIYYPSTGLAQEHLRVGLYQNPPKIFLSESGQATGFFVDVLNHIADQEGWTLHYTPCQWEQCLEMLRQGELDLMPDVAYSEQRAELFDFNNEIVLYNWSTLYRRHGVAIQSLKDLDGRPVGILRGSIQAQSLRRHADQLGFSPLYVELDKPDEILPLAGRGEVDAVVLNRLYAQQERQLVDLHPTPIIIEQSHLHYAAPRGRHTAVLDTIDRHLQTMKSNHQTPYYRSMARWIESSDRARPLPAWLSLLLQILFISSLILLAATFILRGMVRHRTHELAKSQAAIQHSEQMFRSLFDHSADAMLLFNGSSFYDCNRSALKMFAYPDIHAISAIHRDDLFPPIQANGEGSSATANRYLKLAMEQGFQRFEWMHRRANGEVFPSEVTLVPISLNGETLIQVTVRDLSSQYSRQHALEHLQRHLHILSKINHALIYAQDEKRLLEDICRIMVEHAGYRMAWVGYAQYDDERSIKPVAHAGFDMSYLESLRMHWQDEPLGRLPSALAIRQQAPVTVSDIFHYDHYPMLRDEARHYGYAACIALPLKHEMQVFGVLTIYREQAGEFSSDELILLKQVAEELSFGINNHRLSEHNADIHQERKGYQQQIQQAMHQTIQAFSVMLEIRDPYTAGHQRRTADLAVAIAREMELDEQRIEGIRFGAMLHDIGNIQVPAEILIRPGRLSNAERSLVQGHTVAGYEILRNIDFPWPVADMVLNHHERMDGSGYPAGKKGATIPIEARIIAVADMVEAMLSHRPYRVAHSTADTMTELRAGRGIFYDEQVVDACLNLFEQRDYQLPI
jgi:putative nucleotidyltransferase with HDIG domain/PAS domain S-box-containing protein